MLKKMFICITIAHLVSSCMKNFVSITEVNHTSLVPLDGHKIHEGSMALKEMVEEHGISELEQSEVSAIDEANSVELKELKLLATNSNLLEALVKNRDEQF